MIMKEGILEAPNEVFPLMTFRWEFFLHLTLVIQFSMAFIRAIIYCNTFECRILKTNFGRSITLTPSSLKDFWLASERETTACDQFGFETLDSNCDLVS